eukprot:TRINITY_DN20_c0_g1_i1.p1 TRINITY_DN20_c0_g1~~TRINITY_DN20_c0_g1_i1.p1  ORF type:complete len:140 (-),score=8.82 TRINITY_DN20_c0_g1_i1:183-602(-)
MASSVAVAGLRAGSVLYSQSTSMSGRSLQVQSAPARIVCRKADLHPKVYQDAKVFCNGEHVYTVTSTKPELTVDVWSGNHPFYQGSSGTVVLEDGRVEKFKRKYAAMGLGTVAEVPVLTGPNPKMERAKKDGKKGKGRR